MSKEEIFIVSLKNFKKQMLLKDWDEKSSELLFAKFLSENWDKEFLDNEELLDKIILVCEEFEIDVDNVLKLFLDGN